MVSKLKWVFNRWLAMDHPMEDFYRISQLIQHKVLDKRNAKTSPQKFIPEYTFLGVHQKYSFNSLKTFLHDSFDFYKLKYYDLELPDLRQINNWRKDYKHNITSDLGFTHDIPFQNFDKCGDFRYVSVLSRLHHFPTMASLSLIKEDSSFIQLLDNQLSSWEIQNPFLKSINWRSGIEVGIRATNLVFTRMLLNLSDKPNNILKALDDLILLHFEFLIHHFSKFSSANNHLLAELTGIFIITANYQFSGSEKWRKKSFDWLIKELFNQTHPDGFSKEQSTHYHAEVLNMYVTAFFIAEKIGYDIPKKALERLNQMAVFLNYLKIGDSNHPIPIGDSDEGELLFPYFDPEYSIYDSLINDVAILSNNPNLIQPKSKFDFRNLLISGDEGLKRFNKLQLKSSKKNELLSTTRIFKDSGYCFFIEKDTKLCFDVGELGLGKMAAHGHSDILHFVLYYQNYPFIIDPGTFQYHSRHTKWRNYFRGISAHNTISINHLDHAVSAGRMIWLMHPKVNNLTFNENDELVECGAGHNGFTNQGSNVTHSRNIKFHKTTSNYEINDHLKGNGSFNFQYRLHFHPLVKIEHNNTTIVLTNTNNVKVVINNKYFSEAKIINGNSEDPIGWYSGNYNKKTATNSLILELNQENSFSMQTFIDFE